MTLVKFNRDKDKGLSTFSNFVDNFFNDGWNRLPGKSFFDDDNFNIPAVNIQENDKEFNIELAAPGLDKKDFKIEIDHGVLTISTEKENKVEEKDKAGNYTRREFSYHSFRRSFQLPDTVNADDIKAGYDNGLLNITLPKREAVKPKTISIK
ncbi:Hsp20/alpha crystallin family protein [Flexithrix dorotheae]|uniref:Hsp20/alpha crystallin family protein n=1 Tax=Flexithrix dorotheae TaxID=70993 RepID=UPI000362F52C|nr:Hsp20 family protein [Flexithrix dorotheae]